MVLCRTRPGSKAVAWLAVLLMAALMVVIATVVDASLAGALGDAVLLAAVLGFDCLYLTMTIRQDGDDLLVDGLLRTKGVSADSIRAVTGDAGLTLHLYNGNVLGFFGLGGSLLGTFTGEVHANRAAEAINQWRASLNRPRAELDHLRAGPAARLRPDLGSHLVLPMAASLFGVLVLKTIADMS